MKRLATTFLVGVCLLFAMQPRAAQAQTLLFYYIGFDYEYPNPDPSNFGEPGSGYVGIGFVPGLFGPLVADTAHFEYTYMFSGLTPVSSSIVGPYSIVNYSPGTLSIYQDSKSTGTRADYGANPPNPLAPSTFTDGALFLTGTLTGFQFVFNNANGSGSYEAAFTVTGGSQIGNFPLDQRAGWTFAGSSGNALNIPPGYIHQIAGQNFLSKPVAVRSTTWGRLKADYRQ